MRTGSDGGAEIEDGASLGEDFGDGRRKGADGGGGGGGRGTLSRVCV